MMIRLETTGGDLVETFDMPPFDPMPRVMLWGVRVFVRYEPEGIVLLEPRYREAFAYALPTAPSPGGYQESSIDTQYLESVRARMRGAGSGAGTPLVALVSDADGGNARLHWSGGSVRLGPDDRRILLLADVPLRHLEAIIHTFNVAALMPPNMPDGSLKIPNQ